VEARPREIHFLNNAGMSEWLDVLEKKDVVSYDAMIARLDRIEDGNFGDCGSVGGGVSELRFIKTGPGYRIYFGEHNDMVILLRAGTRKTQRSDVIIAQRLWREYNA
jgi:putative addiction module killer protein